MIIKFRKSLSALLMLSCLFACSSNTTESPSTAHNVDSSNDNVSSNRTEDNDAGHDSLFDTFAPNKNADFEVIFFDVDNVVDQDGKSYENCVSDTSETLNHHNNADCYLIKCGNTEILYDCGSQQYYGTDENRTKNFCKNLYKKIITYCEDGVLDYLIVTHADSDHIKNIVVEGGLFDSITNKNWLTDYYKKYTKEEKVTNIFGKPAKQLETISHIIDFESYRVRFDSRYDNRAGDELLKSSEYIQYYTKRDNLIEKANKDGEIKTKYCPASAFFSQVTGNTWDSKYHNYYAIPRDYQKYADDPGLRINLKTYLGTLINEKTKAEYPKYPDQSSGKLNEINVGGSSRYTFDIPLANNVNLRILYNWYYDSYRCKISESNHWIYGDNNEKNDINEDGSNNNMGQPHNNISVCSMIESKNSKLLLLGDLGTYGEDALLKYYAGTDVLCNVDCFKASHHGSTSMRQVAGGKASENSPELFQSILSSSKKLNVIVTGVAQPPRTFFNKNVDDGDGGTINEQEINNPYFSQIKYTAIVEKRLFENIGNNNFDMYATQIVCEGKDGRNGFTNQPFYGDIHVSFSPKCEISYTYHGDIVTYIKKTAGVDNPTFRFKTVYKPIEELEWAKKVGLVV